MRKTLLAVALSITALSAHADYQCSVTPRDDVILSPQQVQVKGENGDLVIKPDGNLTFNGKAYALSAAQREQAQDYQASLRSSLPWIDEGARSRVEKSRKALDKIITEQVGANSSMHGRLTKLDAQLKEHAARGLDEAQSRALIGKSVELARKAREAYLAENPQAGTLLVAGSVGPYGAFLADGSEYRGDYQRSAAEFQAFHRPRVEALLDAGADLLACETLPSFAEIQALAALLQEYPRARAWYSFTLRDAEHLSDGTPLREVMAALADNPQVVAVGINCIALENTPAALAHLHSLTALPLVVYPKSGEHYDAVSKTWHHHGEACASLADYLPQWLAAGAKLIGGCCRTTPKDIAALNAKR